jgi:glucose-1-phosphate adenylyltransferase
MDYRKMLAFHARTRADVTVGVVRIPYDQAFRFGTVRLENSIKITDFEEKTPFPSENVASMGIYIFNKDTLRQCLVDDARRSGSSHDFGYSILPELVKQAHVHAYQFSNYWQDIGTKDAYYAANMELIREEPSFTLNSHWHVLTDGEEWPPVKKYDHGPGHVSNSLVGYGCTIKGRVENSVLSPGVYIDENVIVRDSILMSGVTIGAHGIVDHCILDEHVQVGPYCFLGFGPSTGSEELDITVIGKGSLIPAHTAIGKNCEILPNVKPSDFTDTIIVPGSVVTHSYRKMPVTV